MNDFLGVAMNLDRMIHEPARLVILALLKSVEETDFLFIMKEVGLTGANLSSHMSKLETAGYIITIEKGYSGKTPRTVLSITEEGRDTLIKYKSAIAMVLKYI